MANDEARGWEQQVRDAAARAEEELRRVVTYINDEVVPEVRRNGSQALRSAAAELQKLAQRMDDRRAAAAAQAAAGAPGESKDAGQGETLNRFIHRRSVRLAALLLALGVAGCHHKPATANYPPPPPPRASEAGNGRRQTRG